MTNLKVKRVFQGYAPGDVLVLPDPAAQALIRAYSGVFEIVTALDIDGATGSSSQGSGPSPSAATLPALVVASDLRAGMPVTFSRVAGRLVAARSDTKALSFVMGLLTADVASGFAATPSLGVVTLPDWTAATGAAALVPGVPYYLDAAGGLTTAPDRADVACIAAVAVSLSPTTLMVAPTTPIQL